jgi:hypothetical protein
MNTTELIELTNQLSTDKSYLTPKERIAYLKYLNMANLELYEIASSGLNTIVKKVNVFLDDASQAFLLPDDLFKITSILVNKTPLIIGNINREASILPTQYLVLGNYIYCNITNLGLNFLSAVDPIDNITKKYITLFYVPNPKTLVEIIDDANSETDTPIYPVPYHLFLVHGALYYFYFSNKVFMEKMAYIRKVWEEDKAKLANFKNYGL